MIKLKDVSYDDVLKFFTKEHPIDLESPHFAGNKWGRLHLDQANNELGGVWALCELEVDDILNLVIPFHVAEEGDSILVEEGGMTVRDAIDNLKNSLPDYTEKNPVCWAKIMYWKDKGFSPLFLSVAPVKQGGRSHTNPALGSLFHLDGLHRLLRWGMDGRFESQNYTRDQKLTAYVAGFR